jgi:predicted AAA+ superfamily ATPase
MPNKKEDDMTDAGGSKAFIEDAKRHNQWWSDGTSKDLDAAESHPTRSDLHSLLKSVNEASEKAVDSLVYPIYGQTGIGKTTLLYQFISTILETTAYDPGGRDYEILHSVSPRQVLYIPLEDSLYHLEGSVNAFEQLSAVIDYFQSHVAPRDKQRYILLDDIGALELDSDLKEALLKFVDDDTYLLLSGIVESQVNFTETPADEDLKVEWPTPVLPRKFIDRIKHGSSQGDTRLDVNSDLSKRISVYQSSGVEGPEPIRKIRYALGTGEGDVSTAVSLLEELYFEHLTAEDRSALHDAANEYLRMGGVVHQANDSAVRNELVKSHFLLYLYKELANHESVQKPENLHRLASLAASQAGEELRYTDISEQLEVDRRTIDTYLDALDQGLAVTESHDYSLRRYRRTRLYLRNPRHVVLLSRRAQHYGFERYEEENVFNPEFEYQLARTVGFDHAMRLAYFVSANDVEYCETDVGSVDYILQREDIVLPFVLSYHPHTGNAEKIATEFDPDVGQHTKQDEEQLEEFDYEAPCRFIVTDSLPRNLKDSESLVEERNDVRLCYLPYWLFLLIC